MPKQRKEIHGSRYLKPGKRPNSRGVKKNSLGQKKDNSHSVPRPQSGKTNMLVANPLFRGPPLNVGASRNFVPTLHQSASAEGNSRGRFDASLGSVRQSHENSVKYFSSKHFIDTRK